MNKKDKVAVCSRSFSKHPILRAELLMQYENVSFNDEGFKLEGQDLINFLKGHDKAIIALEKLTEDVVESLPHLRVVSKYGVGLDMIDQQALKKNKIALGWEAGVNARSVSELTLSNMIACLRHVKQAQEDISNGHWTQIQGQQLTGKTIGIIGCGNVGKDLVKLLEPFSCNILVHDIETYAEFYKAYQISPVSLEELLHEAEIISLHLPLDESTTGLISKEKIAAMQDGAILINTARGGIVDETALGVALKEGKLSAAAFDVFAIEPPEDKSLLSLPNLLATPHIGGSSQEAVLAMGRAAIKGLDNHDQL